MLQVGHRRECSGDLAARQRSALFIPSFPQGFGNMAADTIAKKKGARKPTNQNDIRYMEAEVRTVVSDTIPPKKVWGSAP